GRATRVQSRFHNHRRHYVARILCRWLGRPPARRLHGFSWYCRHQLVVQVTADIGHDDADAASGFAPSPPAKMNGIGASLIGLAEDGQPKDPIEDGKAADAAGAAEGPSRVNTELTCRHGGLDALADRKLIPDWIEHDSSPVHHAEHTAADLGAGGVESNTL